MKRDCAIGIAKTKVFISCAVLICAFGFAYAVCLSSDAAAHFIINTQFVYRHLNLTCAVCLRCYRLAKYGTEPKLTFNCDLLTF